MLKPYTTDDDDGAAMVARIITTNITNITAGMTDSGEDETRKEHENLQLVYSLRSMGDTRILYFIVLLWAQVVRSKANPHMCIFMKVRAVKRMLTLEVHPAEPTGDLWPPLDDSSRREMEELDDSDMAIVYAPSRSFDIADGPRQHVLFLLLKDEERTRQVRC